MGARIQESGTFSQNWGDYEYYVRLRGRREVHNGGEVKTSREGGPVLNFGDHGRGGAIKVDKVYAVFLVVAREQGDYEN